MKTRCAIYVRFQVEIRVCSLDKTAFTLGQLGYRSAGLVLVEAMLNDPSPIVRHESAMALSSLGDGSVLLELKKVIDDRDKDVANSALIAFEYLALLNRKKENAKSVPAVRRRYGSDSDLFGSPNRFEKI